MQASSDQGSETPKLLYTLKRTSFYSSGWAQTQWPTQGLPEAAGGNYNPSPETGQVELVLKTSVATKWQSSLSRKYLLLSLECLFLFHYQLTTELRVNLFNVSILDLGDGSGGLVWFFEIEFLCVIFCFFYRFWTRTVSQTFVFIFCLLSHCTILLMDVLEADILPYSRSCGERI